MTIRANAKLAGFTYWVYFVGGIAGFFGGAGNWSSPFTWAVWLPLLVFELTFATWLIAKGVAAPERRQVA